MSRNDVESNKNQNVYDTTRNRNGGYCSKIFSGVCCIIILLILLTVGIVVGYTLIKILPLKKPQFSLVSLERDPSSPVSPDSIMFNAQIQVDNPNKISIDIDSIKTNVYYKSSQVSKGSSNSTKIKAMEKTIVPVKLELTGVKTLMEACMQSDTVKLDSSNEITVKILGFNQKITFKKDTNQKCSDLLPKF